MSTKYTYDNNKRDFQPETNALMEAFNSAPLQIEHPARFYWEAWQDAAHSTTSSDKGVQAAFEN